jgi:hypothetical protein
MDDPDRSPTPDDLETHRVIRGRRWRVSDPRIPEEARQALVNELMSARRAVRDAADEQAERAARDRVHDAKVALGERGVAWWLDDPDITGVRDRICRANRAIARCRDLDDEPRVALVAAVTSQPEARVATVLGCDRERPATDRRQP